jgi:hypothetical protein
VTLNNAWLSGFSDAEGCFGAYNRPSNKYIKIRYVVSQKWEEKLMSKIAKLFDGNIYYLKSYEGYNMVVSSLSKLKKVINYFEKYLLKTKKYTDYSNWLEVHRLVSNKQHLDKSGSDKVKN